MPELNLESNKEIAKPELRNENHGFDPDRRIDASSMSDTKEINEQNKFDPDIRLINPKYFDDNGKLFRTDNDLLPNNSYELNGYKYETDKDGRIVSAEGNLRLKPEGQKKKPISPKLETIAKGDQKETDDRGHIIADQFNGAGFGNLIAQDTNLNRGAYEKWEKEMASAIKEGHQVNARFELNYKGDSHRPDRIAITYSIDGEEFFKGFNNRSNL